MPHEESPQGVEFVVVVSESRVVRLEGIVEIALRLEKPLKQ